MFTKFVQNPFVRVFLVAVSLIFLAGAALNDGWTEWFWGIPFLFLIYKLSPGDKRVRIAAVLVLAGLVVGVSHFKYTSPLVYPLVGQAIETTKPIPTYVYDYEDHMGKMPVYDYRDMKQVMESGECVSCSEPNIVPAGSVLTLEKIIPYTGLSSNPNNIFVFTDSGRTVLTVARDEMVRNNKDGLGTFCERVHWDTCAEDPMPAHFRVLTYLMYYPAAPVLILNVLNPLMILQMIKIELGMVGPLVN